MRRPFLILSVIFFIKGHLSKEVSPTPRASEISPNESIAPGWTSPVEAETGEQGERVRQRVANDEDEVLISTKSKVPTAKTDEVTENEFCHANSSSNDRKCTSSDENANDDDNNSNSSDQTEGQANEVYEKAYKHWINQPATTSGMLGGYDNLDSADIRASREFLNELREQNLLTQTKHVIDCGCGVGRVTKQVLVQYFDKVDMVDFNEKFIDASAEYIGADLMAKVGKRFTSPLQSFQFPADTKYDVVWVQWLTGHLADDDLVQFFQRAKAALAPHGCIIVKDNIFDGPKKKYMSSDHTWMRPLSEHRDIFAAAGLLLVKEQVQPEFENMYEVRMFALKPTETSQKSQTESNTNNAQSLKSSPKVSTKVAKEKHQSQPESKEDEHAWDLLIEAEEGFATRMYKEGKQRWEAISATLDGVLFGRGELNKEDIADSLDFINYLRRRMYMKGEGRALDCGSGIGRVAKHLLLEEFDVVDLVDIIPDFFKAAEEYIDEPDIHRIGHPLLESLVTFTPEPQSYDLIWLQLVTGQLTDDDLIKFLKRAKAGLRKDGMIIIKDTISKNGERQIKNYVLAWVRTEDELLNIFHRAGLEVIHDRVSSIAIDSHEIVIFGLKPKGAPRVEPRPRDPKLEKEYEEMKKALIENPPPRYWLQSAAVEEKIDETEKEKVKALLTKAEDGFPDELYAAAKAKWSSTPTSEKAVLGPWVHLNKEDLANSGDFIAELRAAKILATKQQTGRALDCGSGVARVTRHLLLKEFEAVDLVDFVENFIERTESYGNSGNWYSNIGIIENRFTESLVTFTPQAESYDFIWLQWVTGQLIDEHLIDFLKRARAGLRFGGVIVIKDNVAISRYERDVDARNLGWIRTEAEFREIFHLAGLEVAMERETDLHDNQSDVMIFALKSPKKDESSSAEDEPAPGEDELSPVKENNTATQIEEQISSKDDTLFSKESVLPQNEDDFFGKEYENEFLSNAKDSEEHWKYENDKNDSNVNAKPENESGEVHFENDVKEPIEVIENDEEIIKIQETEKAKEERAWSLLEEGERGYPGKLYNEAKSIWATIPATVDEMIGSVEKLHESDILDSRDFISELKDREILTADRRALDCGSGIGRVTKDVLLKEFDTVDLVDFNHKYLGEAAGYIGGRGMRRVGKLFAESLESFTPQTGHYDLIWIQWVTGQLVDTDLISFLKRAKAGLAPGGVIVLKENVSVSMDRNVNGLHVAWIRSENDLLDAFEAAGLVEVTGRDCGVFDDVADILAYALKPKSENDADADPTAAKNETDKEDEDAIINEKNTLHSGNDSKNIHEEL